MAEEEANGRPGKAARNQPPDESPVRRLTEAIYGTLVMMSVLTALSEESTDPKEVTVSVAGTGMALFLTRWYAEVLADMVAYGKVPRPTERRRIIRNAAPLLVVTAVPVVLLVPAILSVVSLEVAVDVSLFIGTVSLATWGFVRARRAGAGVLGTIAVTATTLIIGLVLVTIKALVH